MPTLHLITSSAPLDQLVEPWRDALAHATTDVPTADPAWLRPACEAAARQQQLRLLTLRHDGGLVAVLPLTLSSEGRGPLRRNVLRLIRADAGTPGAAMRGSMLVLGGFEQAVVTALEAALAGPLKDWDRLELAGMPTDGVMPALLLANTRSLGVPELTMDGYEMRRDLTAPLPARPAGATAAEGVELRLASDEASARRYLDRLGGAPNGDGTAAAILRAAMLSSAHEPSGALPAQLWGLYGRAAAGDDQLWASALTLRGARDGIYLLACQRSASAPMISEQALHVALMERATAEGARSYVAWCPAPSTLFDDQCPLRSLTVERFNTRNTRNRLWNRVQSWRR